jgi:hypothetical protein
MHEEIRRFGHSGIVAEGTNVVEFKNSQVRFVEGLMRDEGFVPALDIEAQYTQQYDAEQNHFTYQVSVYGIYVGREQAWRAAGVMNGRMIMKSTLQVK